MIQDNSIPIEQRIWAPITWDVQLKFTIQDLKEAHFKDVLAFIRHHFFIEEPTCKSIDLIEDVTSREAYIELIKSWMKLDTSLVALSRKTGRIVGVIITKINIKSELTNTYSRVQIYSGETLPAVMALKSEVIKKANAFEELGCEKYLRIYILSVHPSYKSKPVARCLLEACLFNAFHLQCPMVAGIFATSEDQLIAENVGFKKHVEIAYNNWIVDDEVVFDDPGFGNYSAAFMFMRTPDEKTLLDNKKAKELALEEEQFLKSEKEKQRAMKSLGI